MDFEKEIQEIKERNRKVEEDKAWETSVLRKVLVAILTYIIIVFFFLAAGIVNPYVSALVPTVAFFLSTLSLPWFKKLWLSFRKPK